MIEANNCVPDTGLDLRRDANAHSTRTDERRKGRTPKNNRQKPSPRLPYLDVAREHLGTNNPTPFICHSSHPTTSSRAENTATPNRQNNEYAFPTRPHAHTSHGTGRSAGSRWHATFLAIADWKNNGFRVRFVLFIFGVLPLCTQGTGPFGGLLVLYVFTVKNGIEPPVFRLRINYYLLTFYALRVTDA